MRRRGWITLGPQRARAQRSFRKLAAQRRPLRTLRRWVGRKQPMVECELERLRMAPGPFCIRPPAQKTFRLRIQQAGRTIPKVRYWRA
jgi:hypothetical protein